MDRLHGSLSSGLRTGFGRERLQMRTELIRHRMPEQCYAVSRYSHQAGSRVCIQNQQEHKESCDNWFDRFLVL